MTLFYAGNCIGHRGQITALAVPVYADTEEPDKNRIHLITASRDTTIILWGVPAAAPSSSSSSATNSPQKANNRRARRRQKQREKKKRQQKSNNQNDDSTDDDDDNESETATTATGASSSSTTESLSSTMAGLVPSEPLRRLEGHSGFVSDVAVTLNATRIASASWDKQVRVWDGKTGACIAKLVGHTADVLACAFLSNGNRVASTGRDLSIKIWDIATTTTAASCIFTLNGAGKEWMTALASSSSSTFFSASIDGNLRRWEFVPPPLAMQLAERGSTVAAQAKRPLALNCLALSPDGSLLAVGTARSSNSASDNDGSSSSSLSLFDVSSPPNFNHICSIPTDGEAVHDVSFCHSRYWLIAALETRVLVFDVENGRNIAVLLPANNPLFKNPTPTSVCVMARDNVIVCGYNDNVVRCWGVV